MIINNYFAFFHITFDKFLFGNKLHHGVGWGELNEDSFIMPITYYKDIINLRKRFNKNNSPQCEIVFRLIKHDRIFIWVFPFNSQLQQLIDDDIKNISLIKDYENPVDFTKGFKL